MKIKGDFHIHLNENGNSKEYIEILKKAEECGCKVIAPLEYNNLTFYKNGTYDLVKDKIKNYFTGKVVTAIEFVTTLDKDIKSKLGFNYYGYRSDICLYDFEPQKLLKFINDDKLKEYWLDDFDNFYNKMEMYSFNLPGKEWFVNDGHPLSFVTQYVNNYLDKNDEERKKVQEFFEITLNTPSDLTRKHISSPTGKLFFEQKLFPSLSKVLKIAKEIDAKVCIAHPAHMNNNFDYIDYIDSLVKYSYSKADFKNIEYLCFDYMLNTVKESEDIEKYAKQNNLKLLGGSDMRLLKEMYFINENGNKILYEPKPGFAIKESLETNCGDILIEEEVLNDFKDISFYENNLILL